MNAHDRVTLTDALDKALEKGAVINGELVISLADVDLVFVGLRLILSSISKVEEVSGKTVSQRNKEPTPEDIRYIEKLKKDIEQIEHNMPKVIDLGHPKSAEKGFAKLVLTLVELIRKLLEKEAYRRVKRGAFSPVEIEKLGLSLKAIKKKLKQIQTMLGLEDEELNLDLGPLGHLT